MKKITFVLLLTLLLIPNIAFAQVPTIGPTGKCRHFQDAGFADGSPIIDPATNQIRDCGANLNLACLPDPVVNGLWSCQTGTTTQGVFGVIHPPIPLWTVPYGAGGISLILSRIVDIAYSLASLLVLFMFIFGAMQWLMSGGDKDKVADAQKRITSAIIGLALLAVAFPILKVLGNITGFKLF